MGCWSQRLPKTSRKFPNLSWYDGKEVVANFEFQEYAFGYPETAKGYSNDNSLSGKGEHCVDSKFVV